MTPFIMTSNDHVARSGESSLCAELVGDVESHVRLDIGLTIFRYISCSHFLGRGVSFALGVGSRV